MRRCTLEEVARFSGGRVIQGDPSLPVDRLHTDTRTLVIGDCFVALQGDRFDGHEFVREVKNHGAVAALVSQRPTSDLPEGLGLVEVPDTLKALQRFAATYRGLLSTRTIGVTGSSGKTSVKEMIAAVLRTRFKTKATEGNLNNHIGVPLTLIRLDEDDEFGVVEMGMNHPGEIAPLARMTAPTIGVISSIGPAHIEFFADQPAIASEKAELIAALPVNGVAILNGEDEMEPPHRGSYERAGGLGWQFSQFDLARGRRAGRRRWHFFSNPTWRRSRAGPASHGQSRDDWQCASCGSCGK